MKPKDLKLAPIELFEFEGMHDFLEWSLLRGWVRSWLNYCKWYYITALDPSVKMEEFFTVELVNTNWRCTTTDPELVRWGLQWRLFDIVSQLGLDWRPPLFPVKEELGVLPFPYLLGGLTGNDFLVSSEGLIQPRARSGFIVAGSEQSRVECITPQEFKLRLYSSL